MTTTPAGPPGAITEPGARTAPAAGGRQTRRLLVIAVPTLMALLAVLQLHSLLAPTPAAAGPGSAGGVPAPHQRSGEAQPLDPGDLEAFFDQNLPEEMEENDVPGAAVAVVSGGELVFAEGYGFADVAREVPFDPETSLVRIASITKLFTWTAVMQLVERGELDLDADVNTYLDTFQIPDTYAEPITLGHLMSHTGGFEDRGLGIGARERSDVPPLGSYLAEHIPARVRPPGQMSAYSNYGAALAGHIVATVAGVPYEQYVQDHILDPLGMRRTTAWEPVPDHLAGDLALSYNPGSDEPRPFVYDVLVPDGSISASATDMATFMLAHLQDGQLGDARILDTATAQLMHGQSFTAHPEIDGWAHGFKERTLNGEHVILHDGSWQGFQSILLLVPGHDLGLFVSFNSVGGIEAATDLMPAFFDRFLPPASTAPAAPIDPDHPEGDLAGFYRPTRSSHTTIEKLLTLVGALRVAFDGDGTLRFGGRQWVPVAPQVYQELDGTDQLAFVRSEDGRTTYLATDASAFEKVAWYEAIPFNLVVLAAFAIPALTAVIGWPASSLVRRLRGTPAPDRPPWWQVARWVAAAGCATGLAFIVAMVITLASDTSEFLYGVPTSFRLLMLLPILFAGLTAATLAGTVEVWRNGYGSLLARAHYTAVALGMAGCLWFLAAWNLLGFRFG